MTRAGPPGSVRVSADLAVSVTAPDGHTARIRVSDREGEVVIDVDQPITVLRAMPRRADLKLLTGQLSGLVTPAGAGASWPSVRLRTRGHTVLTSTQGGVRPGAGALAVVGLLLVTIVVAGAALLSLRRLLSGPRPR